MTTLRDALRLLLRLQWRFRVLISAVPSGKRRLGRNQNHSEDSTGERPPEEPTARIVAVTTRPQHIQKLLVPDSIARATLTHLQAAGRCECEEFAFWTGFSIGDGVAVVTRAFHPRTTHQFGHVAVDDSAQILSMIDLVHEQGELVLCQLHTHPGDAFHSAIDDRGAYSDEPGFLSFVLPSFGSEGLESAEAYQLTSNGWEHLGCVSRNGILLTFSQVLGYKHTTWQSNIADVQGAPVKSRGEQDDR